MSIKSVNPTRTRRRFLAAQWFLASLNVSRSSGRLVRAGYLGRWATSAQNRKSPARSTRWHHLMPRRATTCLRLVSEVFACIGLVREARDHDLGAVTEGPSVVQSAHEHEAESLPRNHNCQLSHGLAKP